LPVYLLASAGKKDFYVLGHVLVFNLTLLAFNDAHILNVIDILGKVERPKTPHRRKLNITVWNLLTFAILDFIEHLQLSTVNQLTF
jgi:hypothetical protein